MISNNYIPEKINDANAYLDGTRMIGVAASVDLPEVNMKTGTVEGFGVGGEIDSPTIGQWESFEQEVQFNTLYSSAVDKYAKYAERAGKAGQPAGSVGGPRRREVAQGHELHCHGDCGRCAWLSV